MRIVDNTAERVENTAERSVSTAAQRAGKTATMIICPCGHVDLHHMWPHVRVGRHPEKMWRFGNPYMRACRFTSYTRTRMPESTNTLAETGQTHAQTRRHADVDTHRLTLPCRRRGWIPGAMPAAVVDQKPIPPSLLTLCPQVSTPPPLVSLPLSHALSSYTHTHGW